jgi:hypothetical protein
MKGIATLLLALLASIVLLHAQQIPLSGSVVDASDNRPLYNVIILIKNTKGNVIKYTQTNNEGFFSLMLSKKEISQCSNIQFSLMSYKEQTYPLNEKKQKFNIRLEQTSIQIKEVIVKAKRIGEQGDTLIYNVASFANQQDRSIGDVLKKMPGINVDNEGKIKYNGVEINKFYVEGKDLLNGRYGIATKGISYKDVGRVEVMENHQPIKVMNGFTFSDKAAINLKLKDSAKAQCIGNIKLQGGYAEGENSLWNVDAFGMIIKPKLQNMTTLKSNNTGENIKKDLKNFYNDHFMDEATIGLDEYIRTNSSQPSDLEEKRTLFNRTHLFSSSQLWEVRKEWQLKTQIDYLSNNETTHDNTHTTYFMPDRSEIILENEQQKRKQNLLDIATTQETNRSRTYLMHALSATLQWNDTHVQTSGTYPNQQEAEQPIYRLKSNLNWMQRFNKQLVTFTAFNLLHSAPQHLNVNQEKNILYQNTNTRAFYTNENVSYNLALGEFILSVETGIAGLVRSMKSKLVGIADTLGITSNNIKSNYLQLYAIPQIRYSKSGWDITLNTAIKYYSYNWGNRTSRKDDVLLSPHLHINWTATPHFSININGNLSSQSYNIGNLFNGLILTDYRTLKKGYDTYEKVSQKSISGGISYKHSINELFANLAVLRSWNRNPFQSEQYFINSFILYSYQQHPSTSDSWFVMANVSKGLNFLKGIINLNTNYVRSKMALVAESTPISYHTTSGNVCMDINGSFFPWFDWYYQINYGFSTLESDIQQKETLDNWQHTLNLHFLFTKRTMCTLSGEHYRNEISPNVYKTLLISDIQFSYKWKDYELFALVKNLFNKKGYGYNVHNELTSISCHQQIRGREFLLGFSWRR